jgi:hypothetical protein
MHVPKMHWHDMLVSVFSGSALSKANLFHYIPVHSCVLWFWKSAITSWYPTISHEIKFHMMGSLCESFWTHMQSRGESHSKMSYYQFYNQWTDESWCLCYSSVLSMLKCREIHVVVVSSLSELSFWLLLLGFLPTFCLSTHLCIL